MAATSTIEWTDATWNPTTGCTQVSPGCDNCYALKFAERFRNTAGHYFEGGFDLALRPNMLPKPASWKRPSRIFVNSMSDLFHVDVPEAYIDSVFEQIESVGRHTFQLLTKRPERMRRYLRKRYGDDFLPTNLWLGVSVENNDYAWRADMLRETPLGVRFLSVEPLLGPIDRVALDGLSWVIVGGESGHRRRPMDPEWVRDIRDRCISADIPFFFKQWHKAGTGRILDGRTWDEMPRAASPTLTATGRP